MINKPRGTEDILPAGSAIWRKVEQEIHRICKACGYGEIRTPTFESTELFSRGVGSDTDVVKKEMYTFLDKGERSITLRPEGTASAVRAYLENSLYANTQPTKLYYIIPCYRYEKPQSGRLREFHQFGIECFGAASALADAEVIALAAELLKTLNVSGVKININSIGCPACRSGYNEKLRAYLEARKDKLCAACVDRLGRNPMRVMDCKSPVCGEIAASAPKIIDNICGDCREHFDGVRAHLDNIGIEYGINPDIVRGLDYYTRTVFEITSDALGAQSAVCGGGRYDGLVKELGGQDTPGIGFALGLERLVMILKSQQTVFNSDDGVDIFIAAIGAEAELLAMKLARDLRSAGKSAQVDLCGRSVKAQMKYADKLGARFSVVIGDDEVASGTAELKNMETGEKVAVRLDDVGAAISRP